ncbi:MAG: prealbumin-like fold domain-containing protein [Lachnospiraceae bacterium]
MEISFYDEPVKGQIRLVKMDAETKEQLTGAVFSVFAAEDIVTPDGYRHYAAEEFVEAVTVGTDGIGITGKLPLGKYKIRETKAPEGYCLDTGSYLVNLTCKKTIKETEVVTAELRRSENDPTTWKLFKTDTTGKALDGVTFSVKKYDLPEEESGVKQNSSISRMPHQKKKS